MSVHFQQRTSRFTQRMKLTQLMRDTWKDLLNRQANGPLSIADDADHWEALTERLFDFFQECSQVIFCTRHHRTGQQHFS
ncbi:hypothetical protein DEMA109039_22805 [Deinococcus marmoris]